ncbi:Narbonolide/10-deoxymethynolide synthase PikA3, module 5 [Streptomyces fumanus]
MARHSLDPAAGIRAVPSLRRDRPEPATLAAALGALHVHGIEVDWSAYFTAPRAHLDLPTYPFQRERYWLRPLAAPRPPPTGATGPSGPPGPASPTPDSTAPGPSWATPGSPLTAACARALERHGAPAPLLLAGPGACDRATLAARLRELGPLDGVVSVLADQPDDPGAPAAPALTATLALLQALTEVQPGGRLWSVTSGAVAREEGEPVPQPQQAQIWGLGRSAALELPGLWGGLVDLAGTDATPAADLLDQLAAVLAHPAEDQVTIRPDGLHVRRLTHAPAADGDTAWQPTGTVLITGGTGGLGAHVARWAAAAGAARLVLAGRRGPQAPGAADLAAELTAAGTDVLIETCDTADRAAVENLIARIDADGPPLSAVVHAAGITQSARSPTPSPPTPTRSARARPGARPHLDAVLGDRPLDAFVLFSSIAAAWGSGAQAVYAAANAHLDALAQSRRARGLAATSVAWGPWAGDGMAESAEADQLHPARTARHGPAHRAHRPGPRGGPGRHRRDRRGRGLGHLRPPLHRPAPQPPARHPPRGRRGPRRRPRPTNPPPLRPSPDGWAAASGAEREALLLELVRGEVAAVLGHASAEQVRPDQAFSDLGFDSLTAVELRDRLSRAAGVDLPATVVFDSPTRPELAARLRTDLTGDTSVLTPVLAELDGLEAAFARVADEDPAARARVTQRMRRFLERLAALERDDTAPPDATGVESASDEELFALLDDHLEAPGQAPKGDQA